MACVAVPWREELLRVCVMERAQGCVDTSAVVCCWGRRESLSVLPRSGMLMAVRGVPQGWFCQAYSLDLAGGPGCARL